MNNQERTIHSDTYPPQDAVLINCAYDFPHFIQSYSYSFKTPAEAAKLARTITALCAVSHKNVELGLNEVFLNAIEHGNLGITGFEKENLKKANAWDTEIHQRLQDPLYQYKCVDVVVEITPTIITIKVSDQGNGFDWKQFEKNPFILSQDYYGRGLFMARSLCFDEMAFSEKGNQVYCSIYRTLSN